MDALAAEAFLNAEHSVYGLKMRPLSLGHAFALEAVGSPFYAGALGDASQLQLAAWICSRPALASFNASGLSFRLWSWMASKMDFDSQAARWAVYVGDYCAPPQFWNKTAKEKAQPSKIPSAISTVVRLMRLGMSEREAWQTPVGAASWYEVAAYETETGNKLDIVTDGERIAIMRQQAKRKNG
jgi:hypothetical protein